MFRSFAFRRNIGEENSFLLPPGPVCECVCLCVCMLQHGCFLPRSIDTSPRHSALLSPPSPVVAPGRWFCRFFLRGLGSAGDAPCYPNTTDQVLGCRCCCCCYCGCCWRWLTTRSTTEMWTQTSQCLHQVLPAFVTDRRHISHCPLGEKPEHNGYNRSRGGGKKTTKKQHALPQNRAVIGSDCYYRGSYMSYDPIVFQSTRVV